MFKKENLIKFIKSDFYFIIYLILNFLNWHLSGDFDLFFHNGNISFGFIISIIMLLINIGGLTYLSLKLDESYFLIPAIFGALFANNRHLSTENLPYYQIFLSVSLLIPVIIFLVKNKIKIKLKSLGLGLIFMTGAGVLSLINAPKDLDFIFYFLGLNWAPFLIFYLVIVNSNKSNLLDYLTKAMIYLGILVSAQVLYLGIKDNTFIKDQAVNYLGWGISNDASILICSCIPFVFYRMINKKYTTIIPLYIILVIYGIAEAWLMSRGGLLLFAGITLCSYGLTFIVDRKNKHYIIISIIVFILLGLYVLIFQNNIIHKLNIIYNIDFDLNGRDILYEIAVKLYLEYPIFGASFLNSIDSQNRFIIYHSTFFNTLATTGSVGLIALMFHYFQKYKMLISKLSVFVLYASIYLFSTDLYGMLDNTYNALQYTTIMIIVLAIIENSINYDNETSIE
jgi:hypothetical protein